jgi:hypothetical protein
MLSVSPFGSIIDHWERRRRSRLAARMNRVAWLVAMVILVACGQGSSGERARVDGSSAQIGPLPTDTLEAAMDDYRAKRISADSAAAIIAGYQQRTGRAVNIEMDAQLLAALQRREQRRVP